MAAALSKLSVAAVLASPLRRAKDSAAIIADKSAVELRTDLRFIERDLGRLQGLTSKEVRSQHPKYWELQKVKDIAGTVPTHD